MLQAGVIYDVVVLEKGTRTDILRGERRDSGLGTENIRL